MDPDPEKRFLTISVLAMLMCFSCKQPIYTLQTGKPDNQKTNTDSSSGKPVYSFVDPDTTGKRTIYLTFDDGPNNGTQNVIDILNEEKVPATFFLIGLHVKEMPAAKKVMPELRSMTNVELCNHSFTHAYKNHFEKFYQDLPGSLNDFQRCRDSVHLSNDIARTPGNNIWRTPQYSQTTFPRYKPDVDNIHDSGFVLFGWDTEWKYKGAKLRQSVPQMEQEIDSMYVHNLNHRGNHCVILMHDHTFLDSADAAGLREMIRYFKSNPGYRFDVASNHPFLQTNPAPGQNGYALK